MAAAASAAAASGATSPKLEELEQTLISIKECFVYPAGPRKSSAGYQAKDWDLDKPAFTCEIKARSTDSAMTIQFWKDGTLMCTSVAIPLATVKKDKPLTAYLEPVSDSSRYFVVRAQTPEKRTIMIGMTHHTTHTRKHVTAIAVIIHRSSNSTHFDPIRFDVLCVAL